MSAAKFIPNKTESLADLTHDLKDRWIESNTAILVIHGIGNQSPIETIDQFGRELVETLKRACGLKLILTHGLAKKHQSDGLGTWFDNFLRIQRVDDNGDHIGPYLDLYEYYWANMTEDQMDLTDIAAWVKNVTVGARRFYRDNMELGTRSRDKSAFFVNGKFRYWKYMAFIYFFCAFIPSIGFFTSYLLKWLSHIPLVGVLFRPLFNSFKDGWIRHLTNIIGDITIYNTTDEKCKFYQIRQNILSGSVKAIIYLLEPRDTGQFRYDRVVLAGHSLGSQIAYDSVNRLIHLVSEGELAGYARDGKDSNGEFLAKRFTGFITFGSPLDKIAFFLREHIPHEQYIREQILLNFHCFKQRDWSTSPDYPFVIKPVFRRLLDGIPWRNYFDRHDYVSGSLDYYMNLVNFECGYPGGRLSFTHSNYWSDPRMFEDIVANFLI